MTTDQLLAELEVKLAARRERKMGDYKVVPVESTTAMREVWKRMRGYCWYDKYKAMLDAAPAVQGEPVGFIRHVHYHGIARNSEECEVVLYDNAKNMPEGTLLYTAPQPAPNAPTTTFKLGDHVRKTKGSQWKGLVVGTYSTTLTPEGYAVESDTEKGSVQIYPVGALELVGDVAEPDVDVLVGALELAQGFLRNKGYSEEDPLLLGAINAVLTDHRKGGDV